MRPTKGLTHAAPFIALAALMLAVLACNLNAAPPTQTPLPVIIPTATPGIIIPSITPMPFATATDNPIIVAPPTSCFKNTTWPLYTVQAGDTLGTIATRSNTTAEALADANCLANPNLISVGTKLRVPMLPATITPTPSQTPQPGTGPTIGSISLSPAVLVSPGQYQVTTGFITITAANVTNAVRVVFKVSPVGGSPTVIGEDNNMADGASVEWLNTSNVQASIWAEAYSATGVMVQSAPIFVSVNQAAAPSIGGLTVVPSTTNASRPTDLFIGAGTIRLQATNVQNATKVTFYFVSNTAGSIPVQLGQDTNLADGAYYDWPNASATVGTTGGLVWAVATNAANQDARTASIPLYVLQ